MKKTYILMRNTNYGPMGPFQLGSLLSSPTNIESLIDSYIPLPFTQSMPINCSLLFDYKCDFKHNTSSKYGIFTQFLSFLGAGTDSSLGREAIKSQSVSAEKLETKFITPTRDYLESLLQAPAVQKYLKEQRFRANLYLVTGIRIAYGVRAGSMNHETKRSIHMSTSLDTSLLGGASTTVGPQVTRDESQKVTVEFGTSGDYVYAYRVKEVHYCALKRKIVTRDIKGDLYSRERKQAVVGERRDGDESISLEVEDMGQEWVSAKVMRVRAMESVDENGDVCEIVIPL